MLELYYIYLVVMNVLELVLMIVDKRNAIRRRSRIAERDLLVIAALGGALGGWIAMYTVRHKTNHWYFVLWMPLFTAVFAFLTYYLTTSRILG